MGEKEKIDNVGKKSGKKIRRDRSFKMKIDLDIHEGEIISIVGLRVQEKVPF